MMFLFHFAFFLKVFKKNTDKKTLQIIFDSIFKNLEISIREIGYGDASINKKMKGYINVFYDILTKIESWNKMSEKEKGDVLSDYIYQKKDDNDLIDYFDNYVVKLSNSTLNLFINV